MVEVTELVGRLREKADWREAHLQRDREHHKRSMLAFDEDLERQYATVPDVSLAALQYILAENVELRAQLDAAIEAIELALEHPPYLAYGPDGEIDAHIAYNGSDGEKLAVLAPTPLDHLHATLAKLKEGKEHG